MRVLLLSILLSQVGGPGLRSSSSTGNVPTTATYDGRPFGVFPLPNGAMKCGDCYPGTSTTTVFTCPHLGAPVSTGTVTAQPALTSANRMYLQYATVATTNGVGGLTPPASNALRAHLKPMMGATIRWPGESNQITWVGLAESTLSVAPWTPATGPTASGVDLAAVGYQESVSSKFRCCTGDGTNYSCADLVGPAAIPEATHEYLIQVDPRTESGVATTCRVYDRTDGDSAVLRKTTNVLRTLNSINMYFQVAVTTTEDVAKNFQLADLYMCFN
jgi:hypothetical protein